MLLVGAALVPGGGPQIMVTALYLSGAAPLSAQLADTIASDGDALLPAIAVAAKADLVACLCSAVPALIGGYGGYAAVEAGRRGHAGSPPTPSAGGTPIR